MADAQRAVKFSSTHEFEMARRVHRGLLSEEDWAAYGTRGTQVEEPVGVTYRGVEVLKCGPGARAPSSAALRAARGL